jgi:hypothetical protein
MSFAKTVQQILDDSKDVTRRDGWRFLKVGDVVEGVEWSPRIGKRLCCPCGWRGGTKKPTVGVDGVERHRIDQNLHLAPRDCARWREVQYRPPRRLGLFRVVSVRRQQLAAVYLDPQEVAREGFPGMSPSDFIALFCAPGKPDALREVTRIEFERVVDEQ